MPDVYSAVNNLTRNIQHIVSNPSSQTSFDLEEVRHTIIDDLVLTSLFSIDNNLKERTITSVYRLADLLGIRPASLYPLYQAFGEKKIEGFTIPAINIRMLTYDIARVIFRLMIKHSIGAVIFELARSEMRYTKQRPEEYGVAIISAAIKEGYQGPVFLQGDHFQINKEAFTSNKHQELTELKQLIRETLRARFLNIDIDASTLVDLTQPTVAKQQHLNSQMTAFFTQFIRSHQQPGEDITIGGEIGHIGGRKSSLEDLVAFMELYQKYTTTPGLSKVSVQTGTSHGGIPLPDGTLQKVDVDFPLLQSMSNFARERYHLGGAVQHGASTLPLASFDQFALNKTLEVHLSTGIQNIVFEHLPEALKKEIDQWVVSHLASEKGEQTDKQFLYRNRKKALGEFKKALWDLSDEEKAPILAALEEYFETIFLKLNLKDTRDIVDTYVI